MRRLLILATIVALAPATAATAVDLPEELLAHLPLLGEPLREGVSAVEREAATSRTEPDREAAHGPSGSPPEDHGHHASHDARNEPWPDDLAPRSDPVPLVDGGLATVETLAPPAVRETGLLGTLRGTLANVATALRAPADPETGAPAAFRATGEAAVESAAVASAEAAEAARVPAALFVAGAATVLPGSAPAASPIWRKFRHLLWGVLGYSRLARAKLLDLEARNAIHAAVRENPGISTPKISELAKVGRTTATYHLRVLEREGYLASRLVGRTRHYFPVGAPKTLPPEALAILQHPTTGAVAKAVRDTPGIDQSTLCERLGLSPSLAHWHLDRLETFGIVTKARDGRRVRYQPA